MAEPAYYMRAGKPYCVKCAGSFFGAPFPVGVLAGPPRECVKCSAALGRAVPTTPERSDTVEQQTKTTCTVCGHGDSELCAYDECAEQSSRGIWLDVGSYQLGQYDKHRLRHPYPEPDGWKADKDLLMRAVLGFYPDATGFAYKGGVLRFRWNCGEGSGEAFESAMTPGEVAWRY